MYLECKGSRKGEYSTFASVEGHAERRAQVVYANLSRVKEVLGNELPGVFLIDACS